MACLSPDAYLWNQFKENLGFSTSTPAIAQNGMDGIFGSLQGVALYAETPGWFGTFLDASNEIINGAIDSGGEGGLPAAAIGAGAAIAATVALTALVPAATAAAVPVTFMAASLRCRQL